MLFVYNKGTQRLRYIPSPLFIYNKGTHRLRYIPLSATAAGDSEGRLSGSDDLDRLFSELEGADNREFHPVGYSEDVSGKGGVRKKRRRGSLGAGDTDREVSWRR